MDFIWLSDFDVRVGPVEKRQRIVCGFLKKHNTPGALIAWTQHKVRHSSNFDVSRVTEKKKNRRIEGRKKFERDFWSRGFFGGGGKDLQRDFFWVYST